MPIHEMEPEYIGLAGDWHGNGRYGRRALEYAIDRQANVVLHMGDFGIMGADLTIQRYLESLSVVLDAHEIDLYFLDGNHEDHPQLAEYPYAEDGTQVLAKRIFHLPRGFRWQWGDVKFLALGGAHSVDRQSRTPGYSWWPEETVTAEQASKVMQDGEADVMLTHDAPAGWTIPGLGDDRYWPEAEIRTANLHRDLLALVAQTVKPRHLFHGHYHSRYTMDGAPVSSSFDLPRPPLHVIQHVEGLAEDGVMLHNNVLVKRLSELAL